MAFADLARPLENQPLKDIVLERVRRAGHIPFAEFMELALYHPAHGYYFCCDPSRDYHSSPNVHAIFGAVLGRGLASLWRALDRPARFDVFEAGAGSGRLAADVLGWLATAEPDFSAALSYTVQDVSYASPGHTTTLQRSGVPLDRVTVRRDLSGAPDVDGVILSNELLDALPFERVRVADGRLRQLDVGEDRGRLIDVEVEPSPEVSRHFEVLGRLPGEGCVGEANLNAEAWVDRAARGLHRGYLLTLDYGYEAQQLYAPWRKDGTLLTFYRHTSGVDPYERVGLQDITASVNLTSVVRSGEAAGLKTFALSTQAEYLAALGIGESLRRPDAANMQGHLSMRRAVMELTDAAGLGRIRVLLQGKDVPRPVSAGFGVSI